MFDVNNVTGVLTVYQKDNPKNRGKNPVEKRKHFYEHSWDLILSLPLFSPTKTNVLLSYSKHHALTT